MRLTPAGLYGCVGGAGDDLFYIGRHSTDARIMDFAAGDRLDISRFTGGPQDVLLTRHGGWTAVAVADGDGWSELLRVRGVTPAELSDWLITG